MYSTWRLPNSSWARDKAEAGRIVDEALEVVGLRPQEILGKYPHQLSGGQRQRLIVARALLLKPRLIVADEPVSMIDASLRAMILDIMLKLKEDFGISFLYITHDLSTAYQISDRIFILYEGSVTETGDATGVISNPQHPYTQLLIGSVPTPDPSLKWDEDIEVSAEEELGKGDKAGCRFYSRCPHAMEQVSPQPAPNSTRSEKTATTLPATCTSKLVRKGRRADDACASIFIVFRATE